MATSTKPARCQSTDGAVSLTLFDSRQRYARMVDWWGPSFAWADILCLGIVVEREEERLRYRRCGAEGKLGLDGLGLISFRGSSWAERALTVHLARQSWCVGFHALPGRSRACFSGGPAGYCEACQDPVDPSSDAHCSYSLQVAGAQRMSTSPANRDADRWKRHMFSTVLMPGRVRGGMLWLQRPGSEVPDAGLILHQLRKWGPPYGVCRQKRPSAPVSLTTHTSHRLGSYHSTPPLNLV